MRKPRALAIGAAVLALGAYASADAFDVVPGILTTRPPLASPQPYPTLSVPTTTPVSPAAAPEPFSQAGALQERAEEFASSASALGPGVAVRILDVASGTVLADVAGDRAHATASSIKVATAVAALAELGPDTPVPTDVTFAGDTVTLVGHGDLRLTPAILAQLAADTHDSLAAAGVNEVRLAVDDTAFTGATFSPGWGDLDRPWVQPIVALAVNSGRSQGTNEDADPPLAVGEIFAAELREAGTTVREVTRASSPDDAEVLTSWQGTSVGDVVTHTLKHSDNTTAEALGRIVAIHRGHPGTFEGARTAVTEALADVGFDTTGLHLADTCGLDSATRAPARLLADLARAAALGEPAALGPGIAGLPIAGLDGTLKTRLPDSAGLVRAKTGTLVTAVSLTGIAEAGKGRMLAFSILADKVERGAYRQARAELDAFVTSLTRTEESGD
ncbi:MAG: D-alanyl-D-alanine carboxypeptidase [Bowdeniella nasicola]|nr:D-alanyl-D-alanine carboxypeptidase [Bowdeniella nasicola]